MLFLFQNLLDNIYFSIRGLYGSPQRKKGITSCKPFAFSKTLLFHYEQHAISQMITRTSYLQCLLVSLASERERHWMDCHTCIVASRVKDFKLRCAISVTAAADPLCLSQQQQTLFVYHGSNRPSISITAAAILSPSFLLLRLGRSFSSPSSLLLSFSLDGDGECRPEKKTRGNRELGN